MTIRQYLEAIEHDMRRIDDHIKGLSPDAKARHQEEVDKFYDFHAELTKDTDHIKESPELLDDHVGPSDIALLAVVDARTVEIINTLTDE